MFRTSMALFSLSLLVACGEVIDERRSSVTVYGDSYTVVTQTIKTGSRSYEVSRVRVGSRTQQCLVNSPRSCEAAAKDLLNPVSRSER